MALCLHPVLNRDRDWVPCGRCANCTQNARLQKSVRCWLETIGAKSSFFVTLTYDDHNLPLNDGGYPAFSRRDTQNFLKRLRKDFEADGLGKLRYFLTCEYGSEQSIEYYKLKYGIDRGRSHYHLLIFCQDSEIPLELMRVYVSNNWLLGRTQVGSCTAGSIVYSTSYALKDDQVFYQHWDKSDRCRPFRAQSLKPGLGGTPQVLEWLQSYVYNDGKALRDTLSMEGTRVSIPRYLKEKLDPSITEELKARGKQNLAELQDDLCQSHYTHLIYDYFVGGSWYPSSHKPDYTFDNEIRAKRKFIRNLHTKTNRSSNKKHREDPGYSGEFECFD